MEIIAGIGLLAFLIVFHEFGHYLFARMLGVKVLTFSLGFGPKIASFTKGGTEYRLSAIPLGGYVRMFGESVEEELTEEEKKYSFLHQPIWRKSLIAFAGPLFNFILPVLLFFAILVGTEQVFAPIAGTLLEDGAASKAGLLPQDRIVEVDGQKVESFSDLAHLVSEKPNVPMNFSVLRHDETLKIQVTPDSVSVPNPFGKPRLQGRIGIMPAIEMGKITLTPGHPWRHLNVDSLDEIVAIDEKPVAGAQSLLKELPSIGEAHSLTLKKNGAETLTKIMLPPRQNLVAPKVAVDLVYSQVEPQNYIDDQGLVAKSKTLIEEEVQRLEKSYGIALARGFVESVDESASLKGLGLRSHDRIIGLNGEKLTSQAVLQQTLLTPQAFNVLAVMGEDGKNYVLITTIPEDWFRDNMDAGLKGLGIVLAETLKGGEIIERRVGVLEAIARSIEQTVDIVVLTGQSLWMMAKLEVPSSQIGGPIALFDMAHQAAKKGLSYYIFIMSLLSVNLGLLNLLPIPALDGGHLLLFGIEAIQRKPITVKTRTLVTQIGVVFLLSLMAIALFNDVSRLFH
jgi:regulator of sigma E protease